MSLRSLRRAVGAGVGASLLLIQTLAFAAPTRVLVAGDDEVVTPRMVRELTELGLEAVRLEVTPSCERSALDARAKGEGALVALCTSSDGVLVWPVGDAQRPSETVPFRMPGPDGRLLAAIRAAEAARAYAESARESVEEKAPPTSAPTAAMTDDGEEVQSALDAAQASLRMSLPDERARRHQGATRDAHTETLRVAVGAGGLAGSGAPVGTVSGVVEVGATNLLAPFLRIDVPLTSQTMRVGGSSLGMAPGFAGLGANLPILPARSVLIPRVGLGAGVAWLSVTESVPSALAASNANLGWTGHATALSPMAFAEASLSLRIVGPLGIAADGAIGASASRMVARGTGDAVAYWGRPFGAAALRTELLFP